MIKKEQIGAVIKYRMSRSIGSTSLYFTTAYWVDGLLIDTGCAHTAGEFSGILRNEKIDLIVNTHSHEDHIGANRALASSHHCPIMAHPCALRELASTPQKRLRLYQLVMWGHPMPSSALPITDTLETEKYRFRVLYTPGHSNDHISLFETEHRWLFCGDAYVGGKDRALRKDYNIWKIVDSLKAMAQLEPLVLFPGSGTVKDNATMELHSKVAYLEDMGSRVLDYADRGWSRRRIARALFGKELPIAYITLGHFSGKNLVRSFLDDRSL